MFLLREKTKTQQILKILKVLAWLASIGFTVKAGAFLISFIVSYFNPNAAMNLYKGLNLYDLSLFDFQKYSLMVFILVGLTVMKAAIWVMVAKIISKIELKNPFTKDVARRLEFISYTLFTTWLLAIIGNIYINLLGEMTDKLNGTLDAHNYLFMAGLVFIISQIFKRGVELQSENELTV